MNDATITPTDNGPYLIDGSVILRDADGNRTRQATRSPSAAAAARAQSPSAMAATTRRTFQRLTGPRLALPRGLKPSPADESFLGGWPGSPLRRQPQGGRGPQWDELSVPRRLLRTLTRPTHPPSPRNGRSVGHLSYRGAGNAGRGRARQTFATEALAAGVSTFELARVMGTSLAMIDRTYAHLARDSEDSIRARLEARGDRSSVDVAAGGGNNAGR
jgi:hypothetical protein